MTAEPSDRQRVRRSDFQRLERKVDELLRLLRAQTDTHTPAGVTTLPDGQVFLPGTGTLGGTRHRGLSPDAHAALEQLDDQDSPA